MTHLTVLKPIENIFYLKVDVVTAIKGCLSCNVDINEYLFFYLATCKSGIYVCFNPLYQLLLEMDIMRVLKESLSFKYSRSEYLLIYNFDTRKDKPFNYICHIYL